MSQPTNGEATILAIMIFIIGLAIGLYFGVERGQELAASGQVKCELIENADKTTDWQCD